MEVYRVLAAALLCLSSPALSETSWLSPVDGWVPIDIASGSVVEIFRGNLAVGDAVSCDITLQNLYDDSIWVPMATIVFSETGDLRRENGEEFGLQLAALFDDKKAGREFKISATGMDQNFDRTMDRIDNPQSEIQLVMLWSDQSTFLHLAKDGDGQPTMKKSRLQSFDPKHYVVAVSGLKGRIRCAEGT